MSVELLNTMCAACPGVLHRLDRDLGRRQVFSNLPERPIGVRLLFVVYKHFHLCHGKIQISSRRFLYVDF
jgi:hypothetical protein